MSAIFGLIHLDNCPVAPEEVLSMAAALAMYGPHGSGQWHEGAIGLGQNLLQVMPQDLFEQQPLLSTEGDLCEGELCLVVDGQIHNRPELIDMLALGAGAETPDSALILHAYARWGADCVHHLTGTFTFSLWDARIRRLLVVRSPLASPSLFFHATPHTLAFATMPKGLFALPSIARAIDEQYLADYLARTGTEATATFYRAVRRLLPGQMLVVQSDNGQHGRWSVQDFWQPDLTRTLHFRRDDEYVEAFSTLFERVVQDHLRSRAPVGVMMSGGLDSTTVAAVAAQQLGSAGMRLATFTEVPQLNFDGALIRGRYADETPYVQAMARHHSNLDLNLMRGDERVYVDEIDTLFAAAETPFPNASNRIWYETLVAAAQAQGIGVLLTGSGGNVTMSWRGDGLLAQLIGAGEWAQAWQEARASSRRGQVRAPLSDLFMRGVLPHLPAWCFLAVDRVRALDGNRTDTLAAWQNSAPIHPDFARIHRVVERARARGTHLRSRPTSDTRTRRLHSLISSARRGDGLGAGYQARFGVTLRDPTSDVRLVEFCLALPEAQYQRNGVTRWLIRRAMAARLPHEVLANRNRGLQAADWYERLYRARGRILDELARIERCDLARRALDLPRLRTLVEEMAPQSSHAYRQMLEYRNLLERGVMTGAFLRWVEGGS